MINSGRSPLKASELLAAQLRADIASGKLAAGTMLPTEAKLMIEFGVGRPTLREALRLLESEALVRVRRGVRGGVEVLTPTTRPAAHCFSLLLSHAGSTLHEVLALRVELEQQALSKLATRPPTRKALIAMTSACAAHAAAPPGDVPAYVAADDEFRTALVATARSSALLLLTQLLAMTAQPQRIDVLETQSLGVRQKLFANRAATNREVLAGLSVGDIPRAMTAWEEVASALTRNRGVHAPIKLLATSTASAGRAEPG